MKNLEPSQIIALLTPPSPHFIFDMAKYQATGKIGDNHTYSRQSRVNKEASVKSLVEALKISEDDSIRAVICKILGWRKAISAIPTMAEYLNSDSEYLRSEAADALGDILSSKAGQPLLERFKIEESVMVKTTIALSLGASRYGPAAKYLKEYLTHPDDKLRGFSALALGNIGAREYLVDLQNLLKTESDPMVIHRVRKAIDFIENGSKK